jgi:hypothetical protein
MTSCPAQSDLQCALYVDGDANHTQSQASFAIEQAAEDIRAERRVPTVIVSSARARPGGEGDAEGVEAMSWCGVNDAGDEELRSDRRPEAKWRAK